MTRGSQFAEQRVLRELLYYGPFSCWDQGNKAQLIKEVLNARGASSVSPILPTVHGAYVAQDLYFIMRIAVQFLDQVYCKKAAIVKSVPAFGCTDGVSAADNVSGI